MKGKNTLQLNHSEMIRALEYYLNQVQFKENVKVSKINENKSSRYFEIELDALEELGTFSGNKQANENS